MSTTEQREQNETYQGWSNRLTWLVNLHYSNDYALYHDLNERAEEEARRWFEGECGRAFAVRSVADYLRDNTEQLRDLYDDPELNIFSDMLTHALGMVDWREIAENWFEEAVHNVEREAV